MFRGVAINSMSLIDAVKEDNLEAVKTIITGSGCNLNAVDWTGWTALLWCIDFEYVSCARALLEGKADVNKPDGMGSTPLHSASLRGRFECLKVCFPFVFFFFCFFC